MCESYGEIKMKIQLAIILPTIYSFMAFGQDLPKLEWLTCQKNSDCTVTSQSCRPLAINKKFERIFKQSQKLSNSNCRPIQEAKPTTCSQSVCVIDSPDAKLEAECLTKGGKWEGTVRGRGRLT